jgi:hypothetical protein
MSHNTSFSAIIATTRNPALDKLAEVHSLESFGSNGEMLKRKMQFGGYMIEGKGEDKRTRIGFGIVGDGESGIFPLAKGGRSI